MLGVVGRTGHFQMGKASVFAGIPVRRQKRGDSGWEGMRRKGQCGQSKTIDLSCLAGIHKSAEQLSLFRALRGHMLRMPLYGDAEGITFNLHRLNESVRALSRDGKPFAGEVNGLMMQAVGGDHIGTKQAAEMAAGFKLYGMSGGGAVPEIEVGILLFGLNVLYERPAKGHVQKLHAAADAEQRLFGFKRRL